MTLWDGRAALGERAGTDDLVAAELERRAIRKWIRPGQHVLEHGCGTGALARELRAAGAGMVWGFDASLPMIWKARELTPTGDGVLFEAWDVRAKGYDGPLGDIVVTQRMLINLSSWGEQRHTIYRFAMMLPVGGRYLMCENVIAGVNTLNRLRGWIGLPAIVPPAHNRYLSETELATVPHHAPLKLIAVRYPCSTYAVLSRLINAWFAYPAKPRYEARINTLAKYLPSIGSLGQNRLYVWERI